MTTFVLILTLYSGYGSAVNNVPGFENDAACRAAGHEWVENTKSGLGAKMSFVCVGQTKK